MKYKSVRYYLKDYVEYKGNLEIVITPERADEYQKICHDISNAFMVRIEHDNYQLVLKCETPSAFLEVRKHVYIDSIQRGNMICEAPWYYIEFDVPDEIHIFTLGGIDYTIDHFQHTGEVEITVTDSIDGDELVECIKWFHPEANIKYNLCCTGPMKLTIFMSESETWGFVNRIRGVSLGHGREQSQLIFNSSEPVSDDEFPGYKFYSFRGGSIPNYVWPTHTFEQTETRTLKPGDVITFDYKIDDSTIYPHVDIIKEADEWLDTDKMWDMFIKHYTDDSLPEGVAIVKEEKDMAGYKLKDAHNSLKLYMVEDKPTYTPRGAVRGIAHKIEELPEAIRNVQFNEKKGVVTVIWVDGEVTMAKCGPNDIWDPEKGLAIALVKRWFKSTTSMNKWIKGIIPEGCEAESLMDQLIHLYCQKDVEAVTEAVESYQAEMLEKYESVKEG